MTSFLRIRKLDNFVEGVQPNPSYATKGAAGIDLSSAVSVRLYDGVQASIPTGIAVAIQDGYFGQIRSRSGLKRRHGIEAFGGTIDSDYRGEIIVILQSTGSPSFAYFDVKPGMRIAQMVIQKSPQATIQWVDELPETERGSGGFGSTGA